MQTATISYEDLQKKIRMLKTPDDIQGFLKELTASPSASTENPIPKKGPGRGNWRKVQAAEVESELLPAPVLTPKAKVKARPSVRKYETVENELDERIIDLYAKGMTTRDIQGHLRDMYNVAISPEAVSNVTDKILPLVKEWQVRPLSRLYPIMYLDGIHFKVRDSGKIVSRCAYVMLGVNDEGHKEILGIWIGESEGAKFWLQVLTEIKNRGVEDILICCIDGLRGFGEAIESVFPETIIQHCIVHQVRNTMKYVPHKYRKDFCDSLRRIYTAPTEEAGLEELQGVKTAWPQFELYLKSWEGKWAQLSTFFTYPQELRHIIYTNNAIENLNRQFRKVTKTTCIFPHADALQKLLWLAQYDISRNWMWPVRNWGAVMMQLAILFPEKSILS